MTNILRELRYHLTHLITESHGQTFVEFIDDQPLHIVHVKVLLGEMIIQTTRGGKNNLRLHLTDSSVLIHRGTSTIERHGTQAATQVLQDTSRLQCELSARYEYNGLNVVLRRIDALHQREQISQCLTAACRRKDHDIPISMQHRIRGVKLHLTQRFHTKSSKNLIHTINPLPQPLVCARSRNRRTSAWPFWWHAPGSCHDRHPLRA